MRSQAFMMSHEPPMPATKPPRNGTLGFGSLDIAQNAGMAQRTAHKNAAVVRSMLIDGEKLPVSLHATTNPLRTRNKIMRTALAMLKYALAAWLLWASAASAQTSPGLVHGQVPSAAQWNSYFSGKADATNGVMITPLLNAPKMSGLPTSPIGLDPGTIWDNGGSLAIAP